jgi:hypothetical protein
MKGYQVYKAANGFIVQSRDETKGVDYNQRPWVFETWETLSKFLEDRMGSDHGTCGSCGGDGLIK